jgi:hypothetical protein
VLGSVSSERCRVCLASPLYGSIANLSHRVKLWSQVQTWRHGDKMA